MTPTRILVAASLDEPSGIALRRADALASSWGAELHAIHVVRAPRWIDVIFPTRASLDLRVASARVLAATAAFHQFCEVMLGRAFPADRILVREGDVVPRVVDAADQLDADLLVVGASSGGAPSARVPGRMVHRTRRPVLVVRPHAQSNNIVAATDFSDDDFPALRRASALGALLAAPVTFVHNVDSRRARQPDVMTRRFGRLLEMARTLGQGGAEAMVRSCETAADAILDTARIRHADLVVLGTHPRSLIGSPHRGTTEAVIDWAQGSVLAMPHRDPAAS